MELIHHETLIAWGVPNVEFCVPKNAINKGCGI